jgi:hypothetical protein
VKVKEQGVGFMNFKGAPPEDVHISNLPLNTKAHGRFHFVEISLINMKSNHSAYKEYFEDNEMHNGRRASAE